MIELKHLEKQYDNTTPLRDVSVTINDGDVISVIGPSGTGKSLLLRCINLLEKPTSGQIFLDGEEITAKRFNPAKARRKMGMVFQSFNLFAHLTIIENLMLPQLDILKRSRQEAYEKGIELLRRVGLAEKELKYPDQLTDGQKQRVAIARTLAMDPEVILFDEPTSALDPTMTGEVQAVIKDLSQSGKTMIIVTNEMQFARAISNRVFYMDQGGIYEDGPPEQVFDDPQKELTRRFIRQLKVIEVAVESKDYDFHGVAAEIDRYCRKFYLTIRDINRMHLVFEELVQQILVQEIPEPHIRFTAEYSETEHKIDITVRYNGRPFDPADSDNSLSYLLVKNATSDQKYGVIDEDGFTNCFRCVVELSDGSK